LLVGIGIPSAEILVDGRLASRSPDPTFRLIGATALLVYAGPTTWRSRPAVKLSGAARMAG
jgi:hypothetical protein